MTKKRKLLKRQQRMKKKRQKQRKRLQRQKNKRSRQRQKKVKQLAKILKQQHKQHVINQQSRNIIQVVSKYGTRTFQYEKPYRIQDFKNSSGNWKQVKSCRLPSLSQLEFNVHQYMPQKDRFRLGCPQWGGTHYYYRRQLCPINVKKKKKKIDQFVSQAKRQVLLDQGIDPDRQIKLTPSIREVVDE